MGLGTLIKVPKRVHLEVVIQFWGNDAEDKLAANQPCWYNGYTYIHTYVRTYIHSYIHTYILTYCIHTYMHTYIHMCLHTCIHIYICTYIPIYISYTHAYIHRYMHTYIPTYIHTYIHTYIYICIHRWHEASDGFYYGSPREEEPIPCTMQLGRSYLLCPVMLDENAKVPVAIVKKWFPELLR